MHVHAYGCKWSQRSRHKELHVAELSTATRGYTYQTYHLDNVILCCRLCLRSPSSWDDQLPAELLVHCPVLTAMLWSHQHASED